MGRYSEDPRYNILSLRVSDGELETILEQACGADLSPFLRETLMDALENVAVPVVCTCGMFLRMEKFSRAALRGLGPQIRGNPVNHGCCEACAAAIRAEGRAA